MSISYEEGYIQNILTPVYNKYTISQSKVPELSQDAMFKTCIKVTMLKLNVFLYYPADVCLSIEEYFYDLSKKFYHTQIKINKNRIGFFEELIKSIRRDNVFTIKTETKNKYPARLEFSSKETETWFYIRYG